jgi:hypothetical protein
VSVRLRPPASISIKCKDLIEIGNYSTQLDSFGLRLFLVLFRTEGGIMEKNDLPPQKLIQRYDRLERRGNAGGRKCREKDSPQSRSLTSCGRRKFSFRKAGQSVKWPKNCQSRIIPTRRWRREYGGFRTDQAKRLKMSEKENDRLKKLVADLSLDNAILEDAAEGNF